MAYSRNKVVISTSGGYFIYDAFAFLLVPSDFIACAVSGHLMLFERDINRGNVEVDRWC